MKMSLTLLVYEYLIKAAVVPVTSICKASNYPDNLALIASDPLISSLRWKN